MRNKDAHTLTVKQLTPVIEPSFCTKEKYCRDRLNTGSCACNVPDLLGLKNTIESATRQAFDRRFQMSNPTDRSRDDTNRICE